MRKHIELERGRLIAKTIKDIAWTKDCIKNASPTDDDYEYMKTELEELELTLTQLKHMN
tara:strand:- start:352 stop:528 length:177 start_codon:yes stop_codon:yes gene_type:complete